MRLAAVAAAAVLAGAVPRVLLAAGLLPPSLSPFVWSDVLFTWERGLSGHRLPFWDSYFEYPPLVGYLSALLSLLAPSATAYVAFWAILQAAAAATVGFVVAAIPRRGWWAWALAPQLVLFGAMNFDLLAVAALVLALRWEAARAPIRAAGALAAGTLVKLFPLAAFPIVLVRRPLVVRTAAAQLAVFGTLVALSYVPAAGAPFSSLESLGRYSVGIVANPDSVWGLVSAVLTGAGLPSRTLVLVASTVGLVVTYALVVLPAARRSSDAAAPVALAVLTVLLWSRLYSPQYSLWVLPLFVFVPIPFRVFALLTAADCAVFFTISPLTLTRLASDEPTRVVLLAVLAAAVAARHAALVMAWLTVRRATLVEHPPRSDASAL